MIPLIVFVATDGTVNSADPAAIFLFASIGLFVALAILHAVASIAGTITASKGRVINFKCAIPFVSKRALSA